MQRGSRKSFRQLSCYAALSTETVPVSPPYARAMASPRVERRTRRRLPPTPSLPPGRRPEQPPGQTNDTSGGSRPSSTGVPRSAGPVCCRCNGRGKCMSCVCVKQGRVCTSCLPSRTGCHNLAVHQILLMVIGWVGESFRGS